MGDKDRDLLGEAVGKDEVGIGAEEGNALGVAEGALDGARVGVRD